MNHRLLLAAPALVLAVTSCRAVQSSTSDLEVAAAHHYVYRGLLMNQGFGFETEGSLNFRRADGSTVSGYAWGYLDVADDPGEGAIESSNSSRFSRIDLGARWRRDFDLVALSAGVASYNFPNTAITSISSTSEANVSAELLKPWYRPRAVVYYDFQNADDLYVRAGLHPRFELDRALTAEVGLDLGYMGTGQSEFYYGVSTSGLSDFLASGSVTYRRDENFRAFVRAGYSKLMDSDLKSQVALNGLDDTNLSFSIGCGWTY